jgi:hypothetical protein
MGTHLEPRARATKRSLTRGKSHFSCAPNDAILCGIHCQNTEEPAGRLGLRRRYDRRGLIRIIALISAIVHSRSHVVVGQTRLDSGVDVAEAGDQG